MTSGCRSQGHRHRRASVGRTRRRPRQRRRRPASPPGPRGTRRGRRPPGSAADPWSPRARPSAGSGRPASTTVPAPARTSRCRSRRAPRPAPSSRSGLHPAPGSVGQPEPGVADAEQQHAVHRGGAKPCSSPHRCAAAALVTASSAIRYAATSTAAGSGSTSSSASTVQVSARPPPVCRERCSAARCRSADTSPSWSRAGGRRPSTSRRISSDLVAGLLGELLDQLRPRRQGRRR